MLRMLMNVIRRVGRLFSNERRRESDGGKPSYLGASRENRTALSVVLLAAAILNAFPALAQTTGASAFIGTWQTQFNDGGGTWNNTVTINGDFTWSASSLTPATATLPARSCTYSGTYVVSAVDMTRTVTSSTPSPVGSTQCNPVGAITTTPFFTISGSGGVGSTFVDNQGKTWTKTVAPDTSTTVDITGTWSATMSGTVFTGESGAGQTTWLTLVLAQSGSSVSVTSSYSDTLGRSGAGAVDGSISGNTLTFYSIDPDTACASRKLKVTATVTNTAPGSQMTVTFTAPASGTCPALSAPITYTKAGTGPTTEIVASGLWNVAAYYPYCNYTELATFNLTYANGAYSVTTYTSNGITLGSSGKCQNTGPESCAAAGVYQSGQDLLSASQFQAMLVAMQMSCDAAKTPPPQQPGVIQPVNFTSPDSVSFTIIDPEPFGSFSVQMTRAASTPTSYALAVAKSGTGSGTVTSTPAGIDCGASCSAGFSSGAAVSLTATPATGSFFAGWRGDCSGSGSCSVTMNATRKVIATFKPKPFIANTTTSITAASATITTTIDFNAADKGKQGSVFITGWVPTNGLGALGISTANLSRSVRVTATGDNPYLAGKVNSRQVALGTLLAAADPNAWVLVQKTASGWALVVNGQLIPYVTGTLGSFSSAQSILYNTDPSALPGAQFCVGYGTSDTEMIVSGRMLPVADIPGAAATSSGSCNVTDIVVEFYNTNLEHYFITADTSEAAAIDNGSAGPGWMRTGNSFRSGGSTSVCRFYGSQSPGPNSHFYTVDASECAGLQQLQASTPDTEKRWNFESLDFVSTPPATVGINGTCPTGTTPVYRAYNNGFARGVDSNHRITSSLTAISEVVTRGWSNEGVVMCAPN